jgi:hypothetical protein
MSAGTRLPGPSCRSGGSWTSRSEHAWPPWRAAPARPVPGMALPGRRPGQINRPPLRANPETDGRVPITAGQENDMARFMDFHEDLKLYLGLVTGAAHRLLLSDRQAGLLRPGQPRDGDNRLDCRRYVTRPAGCLTTGTSAVPQRGPRFPACWPSGCCWHLRPLVRAASAASAPVSAGRDRPEYRGRDRQRHLRRPPSGHLARS